MSTRLKFMLSTTAYLLVCWHCLLHHGASASSDPSPPTVAAQRLSLRRAARPPPAPRVDPAPSIAPPPRAPAPKPPPSTTGPIETAVAFQRELDRTLGGRAVTFEPSSDVLTAESLGLLDAVAAVVLRAPSWRIEVAGHTDNVGAAEANVDMSARRAAAVARALVERRVSFRRIRVLGKGASQPIADNATPEGRARNRRIQFTVVRRAEAR